MVIYNAATRELTAKIVYYGPGLCGKTTNLKVLHDRLEPGTAGKLLNLQTQTDRTIYFDLLPVELGDIKGYKIRFQLATVPGQTAFNETRRVVLKGVDGIVFVADSQWTMLPKNLEAWQNLKDNLKVNAVNFESIPVVVQYNKRDLADILAVDAMQEALGLSAYPFVEAVASAGRGVTETFKLISKLTFVDLLRRLQGRRAEDEEESAARAAADAAREDDLQTWKDSLLKRESQPAIPRPSRPLSLVPRDPDEAPFDTTELGRGVLDDEAASPYSVPEPPQAAAPPEPGEPANPASTIQMQAVPVEIQIPSDDDDEALAAGEPARDDETPEILSAADEIEIDIPAPPGHAPAVAPLEEPADEPAFLAAEAAQDSRIDVLEQRLRDSDANAAREREAAERQALTVASIQDRIAAASEHVGALAERLAAVERGVGSLQEALASALERLAPAEAASSRAADLESGLRRLESALAELDERMRGETGRQRKDADDVGMALRGLTERGQALERELAEALGRLGASDERLGAVAQVAERVPSLEGELSALRDLAARLPELEGRVESVLREHHELASTFEEKTQQGRREAEDIRSQIAPLLEDRVRRHESDAMLFAEMERLRENLAESLHDLAERVRTRIRE